MDFRWNDWNVEKVEQHGLAPEDAERAVAGAPAGYPLYRGDGKYLVWGRGKGGLLIQVVFVLDDDGTVFVIHARRLTQREKRRYRKHER
ncbi:MAG: hypothetical protein R6X20_03440 [Phycisphaerae bacterium]